MPGHCYVGRLLMYHVGILSTFSLYRPDMCCNHKAPGLFNQNADACLSHSLIIQVWSQAQQWKGWVMCAKQLVPDSFPALLQLPTQQVGMALADMSNGVKLQLSQYAKAPSCPVAVPRTTLVLLQELESSIAVSSASPVSGQTGRSHSNSMQRTQSADKAA